MDSSNVRYEVSYGFLSKHRDNWRGFMQWESCDNKGPLRIYAVNKATREKLDSVDVKVMLPPHPTIRLGCQVVDDKPANHYEICHEPHLSLVGGLLSIPVNFDYDFRCSVFKFRVTLVEAEGKYTELEATGPSFSREVKALLKQFGEGDKVVFDNFKVKCSCETNNRTIKKSIIVTKTNGKTKLQ